MQFNVQDPIGLRLVTLFVGKTNLPGLSLFRLLSGIMTVYYYNMLMETRGQKIRRLLRRYYVLWVKGCSAHMYIKFRQRILTKLLHYFVKFIASSKGRLHPSSPCMPSTVWSPGHTARRGNLKKFCVHEPWLVCVTNRPIIITIIVEAEYDVTNYADRRGCYPPKNN